MILPSPRATLAGCIWLPRILAKAQRLHADALPAGYAERFCHPSGVDGQFLAFFDLTREEILDLSQRSADEAGHWFGVRAASRGIEIEAWNQLALNLGRPGFLLADRLQIGLATVYAHLADRGCQTVFEMLEADEQEAQV